jgi:stalled ribosome rescue protein Dom34
MSTRHAAVFIDHAEAKIFHVDDPAFDPKVIAARHHVKRHPSATAEHHHDEEPFFHDVAKALEGAEEILIVGPSTAKLELVKHIHRHDHLLVDKIVGVETVDHPTDGQLVAFVRKYFHAKDRLKGLVP